MIQLTLYTTLGCHLCQQLEGLLAQLSREPVGLERVEISEDDLLLARYGVRIPVLVDAAGNELDRGFEPERLASWLEARGWLDDEAWQALRRRLNGEDEAPETCGAIVRGGRRYLS
ncbi:MULTISPECIES: glutaredoxin family protein [unclassified Halomonas]|uniref:glutaredoxin family protein n=1 Tax=unclassified Halomonas TaxID=2609666 RepID=UPI002886CF62|nr:MULTISPECIES: glutaredoxin family protein [unclassified Halomonas]MDT0500267.1 glutaredoxin family protein [Halomonas sp. PAR7]MDT0511238.1 glutaredoxin family protein [Halomonas sp. LES1]MDT0590473.1 glutaredoxin family protein [Halomonas sp. PAR8]